MKEMTVEQFRQQKIRNFSLAWEVYGHKIPDTELDKFTTTQLETILAIEQDDEKLKDKINAILSKRCHWT
jgi:hypothetical protein